MGLVEGAEVAGSVSPMVWIRRDATRACRARLSACSVAMKGSLDADVILKIALQMHILQMMITTMEVAIREQIFQNHLNPLSHCFALSAIIFSFSKTLASSICFHSFLLLFSLLSSSWASHKVLSFLTWTQVCSSSSRYA